MRQLSAATARQRKRAANQEAGGKADQGKNIEARQRRRAASQEAGDKADQEKNTEAKQRKRAEILTKSSQKLLSGIHGASAKQGP